MGRLTNVGPRIPTLDPRRIDIAPRRSGRWLMARNDRIKTRDGFACRACGRIAIDLEVDHIVPLFKGGADEDENLQTLCVDCHAKKTLDDRGVKQRIGCDLHGWPQ